jgi:hypothetical protein
MEKKADTGALEAGHSSVPSELENLKNVMETTSPSISNQVEAVAKEPKAVAKEPKAVTKEPNAVAKEEPKAVAKETKEEPKKPKKEFLELEEPLTKAGLMIVEKEAPVAKPVVELTKPVKNKIEVVKEAVLPQEEENVVLLSSDELKQRILGMAEQQAEQQKEQVRTIHKKACIQLLEQVKCYEEPVDSDEDSMPLSREELRTHVLRELDNSKKVHMKEKTVQEYVKELSKETFKEKLKTPPLKPCKEESLQDVHPFLLEYGVNPIKTNTIMIDNRMYHKNDAPAVQVAPVVEVALVEEVKPVAPAEPVAPVAPVKPAAPTNTNNKKNKKKKH